MHRGRSVAFSQISVDPIDYKTTGIDVDEESEVEETNVGEERGIKDLSWTGVTIMGVVFLTVFGMFCVFAGKDCCKSKN